MNDFNIAFVPCRLKSTRLPNKAIQDIYGLSAIERCLINTKAIPGIRKVLIATTTNKEDDILERYNLNGSIEVLRGPENDVLERIIPALNKYKPDNVLRVTGDCPLVSPELSDLLIKKHISNDVDLTYTSSKVALGISCEVYKTEALIRLRGLSPKTNYSEYLVYYFLNNPNYFSINDVPSPTKFEKPWRLTLDENNDLDLLKMIYQYLDAGERPIHFAEVIEFFNLFPDAAKININNTVKYRDDLKLIEFLRKETTFK